MAHLILMSIVLCFVFVVVYLAIFFIDAKKVPAGTKPLPGPLGLPIVGSLPFIPTKHAWFEFTRLAQKYGPIYQTNLAGRNFVWLSSPKIADDLLNKRQPINSSRGFIPGIMHDSRKSMHYLALMANGPDHKRGKRFIQQLLSSSSRSRMSSASYTQTRSLILALLKPDNVTRAFQRKVEIAVAATTGQLAWSDATTPTAVRSIDCSNAMILKISPAGDLVNKLSFLRNLPSWIPLALQPWKRSEIARVDNEHRFWFGKKEEVIFQQNERLEKEFLLEDEERKAFEPQNWTEKFMSMKETDRGVSEDEATYAVGFLAFVGSVLLSVPVQNFFVAMAQEPEWLKKGQDEVDRVCGDRMPRYEDIKELPVVRAIIRECFRWMTPVPVGVPHVSEEDQVYDGYFIPKDSVLCALDWALTHDPIHYPDPDRFNPGRWLDPAFPTYKEPLSIYPQVKAHPGYGWGRRTCPGQDYGEIIHVTMVAGLLWACNIKFKETETVQAASKAINVKAENEFIHVAPGKWEDEEPLVENPKPEAIEEDNNNAVSVITRPEGADNVVVTLRDEWRISVVRGEDIPAVEQTDSPQPSEKIADRGMLSRSDSGIGLLDTDKVSKVVAV